MRAALFQLSSGDDPAANLDTVRGMMDAAHAQGAEPGKAIAHFVMATHCI